MKSSLYLIHGWGCDSSTWQPLAPLLENIFEIHLIDLPGFGKAEPLDQWSPTAVVDYLAAQIKDNSFVLGWSLGGNLAVQLAVHYPKKITGLITLASNLKFVSDETYSCGMDRIVNKNFNAAYSSDPSGTLKMFVGLIAQGDQNERQLLKRLRQSLLVQSNKKQSNKKGSESFDTNDSDPFLETLASADFNNRFSNWVQALEYLSESDNRKIYAELKVPGLHLLAEKDVLVPVSCQSQYLALNSSQEVAVVRDAAHAAHWSQPEQVAEFIVDWAQKTKKGQSFESDPFLFFKKNVAASFGRAASTYDQAADLQRKVGEKLLQTLESSESVLSVLDLGCGTGFFLPSLQKKFSRAHLVGVDIAEPMLQTNYCDPNYYLVCADAETLPFADKSFGRIYSNFSLQWCFNLAELFAELHRTLTSDGELVFTTLGESSLHELKTAWQAVDDQVHVNRFFSLHQWQGAVQQKFGQFDLHVETEVCYFPNFKSLAKSLKLLGAHNLNEGRPLGLTGRKKYQALESAYERFRTPLGLPLSYEVIYGRVKKNG